MSRPVDVAKLANSIKKELDYYWSLDEGIDRSATSCMIYKVQNHIREVDKFSYQPLVISVGPYHHGAAALNNLQKEKWNYLDYFLKLHSQRSLYDYLGAICNVAKQARNCYAEDIKMNDDEFLQMLLLDGCFLLVSLGGTNIILEHRLQLYREKHSLQDTITERGNGSEDGTSTEAAPMNQETTENEATEGDPKVGQWFIRFLNHDLFLLENQIPFFIVKALYEVLVGDERILFPPFTDQLAKHVETALRWYPKAIQETDRPKDFEHILHLCHMYFRPSQKPEDYQHNQIGPQYLHEFLSFGRKYFKLGHHLEDNESISLNQAEHYLQTGQELNRWRRAEQYLEAGVKFKRREYDELEPHSLLDVKFRDGAMEMPCVVIDESTASLFRNLIAFEQTCPQYGDDFTAYIVLLSQLVSAPEDVKLLSKRGIIVHHLDSDLQVSDLFTLLSKDVVFDFNGAYYLKALCQTLEAHYQNRLNRWMAWLWTNHFSNPWLVLAAVGTIVVLVCTVLQTVYGILAYTSPPK